MPTSNQLHVDKLLSNISVKYKSDAYIADQVFPTVPVKHTTDLYRVYVRNFRIPETKRANRGLANEHEFDVTTSSYILQENALKDYISDRDVENYDLASLRSDTTEELTDVILRRKEKDVADLMTTTTWSLNVSLTAAQLFTAQTTVSNPIPVYDTAATTIIENGGMAPNLAILPRTGFIAAKNHISILDRVKYTSKEMTKEMLASLFGIQQLLVPETVLDSSARGATSVITPIWGDSSFVGFRPARPGPRVPSSGYVFEKSMPLVRRWRVDERKSEAIEVAKEYQVRPVATLSGYLINNVV